MIHKFFCGTKTAGKTQAATWGSSSKDWAFFRRTQSWKSCLTFSKLMKYSLGFCRNSWSGFGSAAKSSWFSSWIGWIGINLIVKFPLPLDLQYNTGSLKKLGLSYILHSTWKSATFVIHSFRRCDRAHKTFFISRKRENNYNNCRKQCVKVEKILKGSLDSIPSPSPSVKIQIMGEKVSLRCKGKTLLGDVNKVFVFKSLLTMATMFCLCTSSKLSCS